MQQRVDRLRQHLGLRSQFQLQRRRLADQNDGELPQGRDHLGRLLLQQLQRYSLLTQLSSSASANSISIASLKSWSCRSSASPMASSASRNSATESKCQPLSTSQRSSPTTITLRSRILSMIWLALWTIPEKSTMVTILRIARIRLMDVGTALMIVRWVRFRWGKRWTAAVLIYCSILKNKNADIFDVFAFNK